MKLKLVSLLILVGLHEIHARVSVSVTSNSNQEGISDSDYPWTYVCINETIDGPACQRQFVEGNEGPKVPLKTCILTCGPYGALWPYPTGKVSLGSTLSNFSSANLELGTVTVPENNADILQMTTIAFGILQDYVRVKIPEDYQEGSNDGRLVINVVIENLDKRITLETNESYTLTTSLDALQPVVNNVEIVDAPKFRYRGINFDTSRNFVPFKDLRRLIDGLSHNKLNIFHWHLTDSNSFPFYSKRVPQMAIYGTISSKKIYMPDQIVEFLNYANQRGVKVIPELDAPAHSGNGWQFGEKEGLGQLSLCVNAEPYWDYCIQPPCGQLNPINNNTYAVLGDLFKDMLEVFDNDIFHMGGDEISFDCWLASQEITDWMSIHNSTDLMDLWGIFQTTALQKLREASPNTAITPIVWTSEMTARAREYIPPEDYIIHIWSKSTDDIVAPIYNEKYRVILSNNDTVYLDHGYGPWRGTRHAVTRKSWHVLYSQDLIGQIANVSGEAVANEMYESGRLLGGEACMWSEKVDGLNMDGKIWPRTSAYAERLWSNPPSGSTRFAYPRLIHQRETMILRGIFPDTLLPEACYHIWGFCDRFD
ncbi:Chitooligosaccharidolytic beta-N-acetylglucosaminidase [Orchesella cincta]|uniref:beta-N-acetylhexosaminidase n=1 Tax=Orchesella cincta TaxID=48709 RepID=A0A1D2MSX5_ORCCI|nr:Chitooligosaccharidolytic beta-N-acetylglucosaminidase [Orchesella cincta]